MIQNLKENCSWLEKSHKKFGYFHASSQKPENLLFHWLLSSKAYKVLDEKVQESYISRHEKVVQSLKKILTLGSKIDMRNLVNFNASSGKYENLHFDVLLISKIYYV